VQWNTSTDIYVYPLRLWRRIGHYR